MTETKAERLADALNEFLSASPDVEAAAVVSYDGLAMASALPPEMDEDRLGAMSAALLSLGEQAARGLGRGDLRQVFVEAEDGFVFLMSARDQAVLAAVTDRQAKIGLMLYEMRRAAGMIGAILEPYEPYESAGAADLDGLEPADGPDIEPVEPVEPLEPVGPPAHAEPAEAPAAASPYPYAVVPNPAADGTVAPDSATHETAPRWS